MKHYQRKRREQQHYTKQKRKSNLNHKAKINAIRKQMTITILTTSVQKEKKIIIKVELEGKNIWQEGG